MFVVVVDMTDPVAGWVKDGPDRPVDMAYSSRPASVWTYWDGFYDPESGIINYEITVAVNDLVNSRVILHKRLL